MRTCIQCGNIAEGRYCEHCGQKQDVPRLTFKTFFNDFFSRIYGLDGTMPRTIISLFKQPGFVPKEYIKGVRGLYAGPVGYYFILFAIYLLLIPLLQVNMDDYSGTEEVRKSFQSMLNDGKVAEATEAQNTVKNLLFKNMQFMLVFALPFIALWLKIFFRKSSYNILEGIVFAFYTHGHMVIFNMVSITFYAITGMPLRLLNSMVGLVFFAVSASAFYTDAVTIKGVIKSTLAYSFAFICFMILMVLVGPFVFKVYDLFTG